MKIKNQFWQPIASHTQPDKEILGGKGANLVCLVKAGFDVPPGAILTTKLFLRHKEISDADLFSIIEQAIQAYPQDTLWAVRSSAADEDAADASFAGQHDTFLNVRKNDLLDAVKKCWDSAFASHAATYRQDLADSGPAEMAVVLMQMVKAKCAGVLFTRHPVRPDIDRIVVEGIPGLGEDLVSGRKDPDRVELARAGQRVGSHAQNKDKNCLDPVGDECFAQAAWSLEQAFNCPQDMEWAFDGQKLWLIQTRPITTLKRPAKAWTRSWGDEFWAEATTPLQYTFLGRWIKENYMDEVARINGWDFLKDVEPFARIHSHVYFNSEYIYRSMRMIPPDLRIERFFAWMPPYWRAEMPGIEFKRMLGLNNFIRSRLHDKNASLFSHYKKLPAYVRSVKQKLGPGLKDDFTKLDDKALWERLKENDKMGGAHFTFIRWGLASYLMPMRLACAWITENWTSHGQASDPEGHFFEMLLTDPSGNQTMSVNKELKNLGKEASRIPSLMEFIKKKSKTPSIEEIQNLSGSKTFVRKMKKFMGDHGHRGTSRELHLPRWMDDSSLVLGPALAFAVSGPVGPEKSHVPDLESEWLDQIAKNPGGWWKKLFAKKILNLARAYTQYRENQRYALDFILTDMRHVILEVGKRLAEKRLLKKAGDIFFLRHNELIGLWHGQIKTPAGLKKRRADFEADSKNLPPEWIIDGKAWPDPSEQKGLDNSDNKILAGTGASPGVATGTARVVRSVHELQTVRKGEILVASNTDSGWTPVFGLVSGLVVQTGGMLSHAAIVAREYQIPAATGVANACFLIATGDALEINGHTGHVTITKKTGQ